ncbi:hypothetical protein BOX15_Mlig027540g1 [Macrostomum lignano]|uniref:Cadherin domain-containing protein n=1 Tax=Macrostomum lignano TaxID=282301 RepID=A0A267GIP0_9PLAT|nr:hypothetical protein BOX15_Mlig027540g1 [Macrostomum lignano]
MLHAGPLLPLIAALLLLPGRSLQLQSPAFSVSEGELPPRLLGNLVTQSRLDWNSSVLAGLRFTVMRGPTDLFDVADGGNLWQRAPLDREASCAGFADCHLQLQVATSSPSELFIVHITVVDINDNTPSFAAVLSGSADGSFSLNISEASPVGSVFELPAARDPDSPRLSVQTYQLDADSNLLELLPGRAPPAVRLLRQLDRERESRHAFVLRAVDGGVPALTGTLSAVLNVIDENDETPRIVSGCDNISRSEELPAGSDLAHLSGRDADVGRNAELRWRLRSVSGACATPACVSPLPAAAQAALGSTFRVDPVDGTLSLQRRLDFEAYSTATLEVEVSDLGSPPRSAACRMTVTVIDANDNSPAVTVSGFGRGNPVEVTEESPAGQPAGFVFAEDKDSGEAGRVTCESLTAGLKLLEPQVAAGSAYYEMRTAAVFDRELADRLLGTVRCRDYGTPPKTTEVQFNVTIRDINDNAPGFRRAREEISIDENGAAGQLLLDLQASDPDAGSNGLISYSIRPPEAAKTFRVLDNGTLVSKIVLDRETTGEHEFDVVATDAGSPPKTSQVRVRIRLTDVNDCPPVFVGAPLLEFRVSESASVGSLVGRANATDADLGEAGRVSFAMRSVEGNAAASAAFDVDADGSVRVRAALDRERQDRYFLRIAAFDHGQERLSATIDATIFVEDVNDNSPTVTWPSLSNSTVRVSYLAPSGTRVCRIAAFDLDAGQNGALEFLLADAGGDDGYFKVNATSGEVLLTADRRRLTASDVGRRFQLRLRVRDRGVPARDAETMPLLQVLVDDSPPPGHRLPTASLPAGLSASELNFLLIIVICSVTFVLSCVLVASIWHTRRRLLGGGSGSSGGGGGGGRGGRGNAEDAAAAIKLASAAAGDSPPAAPRSMGSSDAGGGGGVGYGSDGGTRLGILQTASPAGSGGGGGEGGRDFLLPMRHYREFDYMAPAFGPAAAAAAAAVPQRPVLGVRQRPGHHLLR